MTEYARLRPLIGVATMDIEATLEALLTRLEHADLSGIVKITIVTDNGPLNFKMNLKTHQLLSAKRKKNRANDRNVDLELILSAATWAEIAMGHLAPLQAFAGGKLRIRGDADLANRMYEHLKEDHAGITSVCK